MPLGTLSLVAAAAALAGVLPSSSAQPSGQPDSQAPWISEGPTGRVALRDGWVFARDPNNRGLRRGWAHGRFGGSVVSVPHSANALPVTGRGGIANYAGSVAWYRTGFTLSSAGTYAVRFESVNHAATVWLDGHVIGHHVGTYLPFETRVRASAGPHILVVRADWRSPNAQARAGFHRTWFNFGGVNREVTIRPVGATDLVAPTIATKLTSSGAQVDVSVEVHNYGPPRVISPGGTLQRAGQLVPLDFGHLTLRTGGVAIAHARANISGPALWSTSQPNMYDLDIKADGSAEYRSRVGLREISQAGSDLLLNGKRVVLRGASIQEDVLSHGDALTPADQSAIVAELRAVGADATRSQHPLDLGMLEKLDAAGILVWQGVGPVDAPGYWTSATPTLERLAEKRVRTTVRQAQAHPSVIAWNLANELAGNGHANGQVTYVERISRFLHATDPGRLVALDIWGTHPPRIAGPLYANIDAIGETDYLGWYESPLAPPAVLASKIRARISQLRALFPRKVLIVSEFGAEANSLNPQARPGGYAFQAALLQRHIAAYESLGYLSGMLVWDLRDFAVAPSFDGGSIRHAVKDIRLVRGVNQKGLIDYAGRPKPAFAAVRAAFAALPFG
ncbi:MAG: glycoside hydrolase family 2 protein [Solirubrobacteraceae bacterium]